MENEILKTNDLIPADAKQIVQSARKRAYKMADTSLVMQNWLGEKRISEEVLEGEDRAKYGAGVIKSLASKLTAEFGKGFTQNNLYYCKQFYEVFPEIFHARVENLICLLYLGHISEFCSKLMIRKLVNGIWRKLQANLGATELFNAISLLNIITGCLPPTISHQWKRRCRKKQLNFRTTNWNLSRIL